eukprot:TRINITY_DN1409_c0_g1_i4.p1 TRINITY_DN1409_c0_g1~~TRINITY_DN1409_c0_g1_i4.p1  ORF type:complete len:476 (+),score=108.81 TRINITY_DN1409_c0_g1_i4:166-1593(+)
MASVYVHDRTEYGSGPVVVDTEPTMSSCPPVREFDFSSKEDDSSSGDMHALVANGEGMFSQWTVNGGDDSRAKRRPYTLINTREKWSDEEHRLFLEGIYMFGRDWKKIHEYIGSKTLRQVRSHAQKHFLKLEKMAKLGTPVAIPPPRRKRRMVVPSTAFPITATSSPPHAAPTTKNTTDMDVARQGSSESSSITPTTVPITATSSPPHAAPTTKNTTDMDVARQGSSESSSITPTKSIPVHQLVVGSMNVERVTLESSSTTAPPTSSSSFPSSSFASSSFASSSSAPSTLDHGAMVTERPPHTAPHGRAMQSFAAEDTLLSDLERSLQSFRSAFAERMTTRGPSGLSFQHGNMAAALLLFMTSESPDEWNRTIRTMSRPDLALFTHLLDSARSKLKPFLDDAFRSDGVKMHERIEPMDERTGHPIHHYHHHHQQPCGFESHSSWPVSSSSGMTSSCAHGGHTSAFRPLVQRKPFQ